MMIYWLVGLEHGFYFFHILGIIIPTDSYFSEGWLNHQPVDEEAAGKSLEKRDKVGTKTVNFGGHGSLPKLGDAQDTMILLKSQFINRVVFILDIAY